MKLEHLDIGGFGRLHDLSLDLGPHLTIISGANESGKSTLQRAIRAALFGLDAGGPGRPVERSDWHRWQPWSPVPYGLALSYKLDDGREFRVAMRLDRRRQSVEVREIGRGDVTAEMRHGRLVAPGLVHLGIDESVFCATACLDDESLHLGARDTPAQHAQRLHEAIERLSDAHGDTTTREALVRLDEARRRIGSERRVTSPLGRAVHRLRQLDMLIADAKRRTEAIVAEQESLRELEKDASQAAQRQAEAEQRWLAGRIAAIDVEMAEISALEAAISSVDAEDLSASPGVALHEEERVLALGSELHAATVAEDRAARDWQNVQAELAAIDRRRHEIQSGLAVLAGPADVDASVIREVATLRADINAHESARAATLDAADDARREALRIEIAHTGLQYIGVGDAAEVSKSVGQALRRSPLALGLAGAAVLACATAATATPMRQWAWAWSSLAAALVCVLASIVAGRGHRRSVRHARLILAGHRIDKSASRNELARLAARLPKLISLHNELLAEEGSSDEKSAQRRAIEAKLDELRTSAIEMALQANVVVATSDNPSIAALDAIESLIADSLRRKELTVEIETLAARRAGLDRLRMAAESATHEREKIEEVLRQHLLRAGVSSDLPVTLAIAAFRSACRRRRDSEQAHRETAAAKVRLRQLGSPEALAERRLEFLQQLRRRGGSTDADTAPLDAKTLATLERDVDYAQRQFAASSAKAVELRGRLNALIEHAPPLADLDDEYAHLAAFKSRAERQLLALEMAQSMIETTTKSVHESLAPKLAAFVGNRLSLLTGERYRSADVQSSDFAVSLLGSERPEYVPLPLVSHGTRDQVSLLLRIALAQALGTGESLPVILDEPLITSDDERQRRALEFLAELSSQQQVILTSCSQATTDALRSLRDDTTVISLDTGPTMTVISGQREGRRLAAGAE